jgi:amino acid adenylation domain-containing protein
MHPYFTHAAQQFAHVVAAHAQRPALIWNVGEHTTYDELDRFSNRIARVLLDRGVRKRDTVCVSLDKCLLAYGTIVACLKIGATYFVVDPANPPSRTQAMLDRCRPKAAIGASEANDASFLGGVTDAPVDPDWAIDGSDPAYVMFTSGSTGAPKGVTISQNNVVHFLRWTQSEFQIGTSDVFTNLNPLFFDNSVFDIYSSLFSGAALVPFAAPTMSDPQALVRRIDGLGCTSYFSVPSLLIFLQRLKLIGRDSFPSLRRIVFGGEGYPKPTLGKLYEHVGSRIELCNVYGPTECTCICSIYRIGADDLTDLRGLPPLGALTPNFSYMIVGAAGLPVAAGESGELYLGGPCVGLGYYDAPGLTAGAFVQNPAEPRFLDRMYRTGDLVRLDSLDGKLYFVGRDDTQVKHQGYRIELGEIEHALASVAGVDEAVAIQVIDGETSRLIAVIATAADLTPRRIKEAIAATLPRYMIPERIVALPQLPKNANGKVDRHAMRESLVTGRL